MTNTLPTAATRVDISTRPVPAPVMPIGWTPELLTAVQTGQITYRRAQSLAVAHMDRIDRNSAGRLPSDNILASGDHMTAAYHEGRLRFSIVEGSLQVRERKARFTRPVLWTLPGVRNNSPRPVTA